MSELSSRAAGAGVPLTSAAGRGLVAAAVLGSGVAFLDGSVVNVALPTMARDLGGGFAVMQWVLDGYLLTLSALLLLGGALGDRYGRRQVFVLGLAVFTAASLACGLAPTGFALIVARLVQGAGGALLVPGSLALIDATIRAPDRGRAIGTWAGLTGVASAIGPFVGGWLVDAVSWRLVFFINVPLAAAAVTAALRYVPENRDTSATGRPDLPGAASITIGLAGLVVALIQGPAHGWTALPVTAGVVGAAALAAFPLIEHRKREPLLPLGLFRSAQFTGANITTLAVYAALGGALFLLTLQLQLSMRYSALGAGLATLPTTVIMLLLSGRIGGPAQRTGPRLPMTLGPLVAGAALALLSLARPGASYLAGVLPGVTVFGFGLAITVAPLTSAVLGAVDEQHVGTASGANNAISRLAGLLAVAVLPLVRASTTSRPPTCVLVCSSRRAISRKPAMARLNCTRCIPAVFEEDEQVFVHPRNPYVRVDALRSARPLRIELDGAVLAESSSPVMVFETGLPTRYYIKRTAVNFDYLLLTDTITSCPYKGTTSEYLSIRVGDTVHPDLACAYDFPTRQLSPIAGLIAFYNEKVDIFLDGQRLERPRTHFFPWLTPADG